MAYKEPFFVAFETEGHGTYWELNLRQTLSVGAATPFEVDGYIGTFDTLDELIAFARLTERELLLVTKEVFLKREEMKEGAK